MEAILDFHMKKAHNFEHNPTNRFPTPEIYKKEVLHKILGQPDQKLAVYNGLHPVDDAFSYFRGINVTFLHLYGENYYYDLNKSISYVNAFKNEFHWETTGWNKWILAIHRDWWRPYWILRFKTFCLPFQKRRRSFFFTNTLRYLKQSSNVTCRRLVSESWFWTLLY